MIFARLLAATASAYSTRQIIVSGDPGANEIFGWVVALSDDGQTIAAGSPADDSTFSDTGAVYIFTKSGSSWTQQQKLTASDKETSDFFGRSVAISADGNTVIGGAPFEDVSPYTTNGAAYVFTRSGSTWTEQAKLAPNDMEGGERFGWSVALSDDGNTALIGAYLENTSPYTDNGAAYVFTRSGSTWTQQAKLTASDLQTSDLLGISVALSSDGNTAILGASNESTSPYTSNGAAYVFTRSGSTWTQQAKLTASDLGNSDNFGVSVAISDNGNTAIIGAPEKTGSNGAVYVFTRSGSTWTQQQKLVAPTTLASSKFGQSVALSGDGTQAMVGRIGGFINDPGTAYLYKLQGGTWSVRHLFTMGSNSSASPNYYGNAVGISADTGAVIIVGFPYYNDGTADVGGVYIYT